MREEILVTDTSMAVKMEVHSKVIRRAIDAWAEENLRAPKLGRSRGRVFVEPGDAYYIYIPSLQTYYFSKVYKHKLLIIIQNAAISAGIKVDYVNVPLGDRTPYTCTFEDYGFDMVVDDPESLYYYQNEIVEKASIPDAKQVVFEIQTGRGKTKTSQKTVVNRKVRSAFVHRPAYVDKCKFDLIEDETGLRLKESEVWVCKGVESIYKLRDAGESGELDRLGIKAIIIPTVTMMLFIKQYINTAATVPMDMERFWDIIGVGCIINDEVHEHFLLVYLLALLTNPPFLLDMSATLKPGDSKKFIADRYLERFPVETRVTVKHVPIVDVVALYYQIHNMKLIQKVARMSMYNHGVFETELKRLGLQKDYFKMIYEVLEQSYLNRYQPGQKAVVYFSKVEFCEDFANYLRQRLHNHPNELFSHLVVYKFNAGDSYEDFVDADIGCSTPSKAGTAIDIPDLVTAIITVALDDKQLNEQITGRPRKIRKWPINPKVVLLHCSGIQKHINYLNSRFKNLKDKVLSFKIASSPYVIRRNK